MENRKVYHVVVAIRDDYGTLRIRLFFPTAQMRKCFCRSHREICVDIGRRPMLSTNDDLCRTRMNLNFYPQLRDFVSIWDSQIEY